MPFVEIETENDLLRREIFAAGTRMYPRAVPA
jgi:hypothetical protein